MSTIFLSANDIFTLADTNTNDAVIGRPGGTETVILQGNPTGTLLDGNIEIVQVAGTASNTTLQVNSTTGRLELSSGGVVYATFAGGLNQAVDLQFTDGNVTLTQTGANSYSIANPTNSNDIATFNPTTSLSGSAVGRGNATSTAGDAPNTGGGDGSNPVLPTINISPFGGQFLEGDLLNTQVTFTVSLSEPSSNQVSVDYQTLSFAALSEDVALELYGSTAEADFIGANGTMIFAPGVTQQTFSIEILGDTRVEQNENFAVALDNPQGGVLDSSIVADFGTIAFTILDDDQPPTPSDDHSNNRNSTATPLVLDIATTGEIERNGDTDVFRLSVVAGQQYTVAVTNPDDIGISNEDAYLSIYNVNGYETLLRGSTGQTNTVTFEADGTGTAYFEIENASLSGPDGNTYGITVSEFGSQNGGSPFAVDDDIYPATAITYIESIWYGTGVSSSGTGFIIGENDVLTASHVIYNESRGGLADEVWVYPSYDPYTFDNTPYKPVFFEYFPNFDPDNDGFFSPGDGNPSTLGGVEWDIALLSFDKDIGNQFGWFGIDWDFSGFEGPVDVMGHPGVYNAQNMYDRGFVVRDGVDAVYDIDNDTIELNPGNSGGPIYYDYGSGPYAVGIVSTTGYATEIGAHRSWLENSMLANDAYLGTGASRSSEPNGTSGVPISLVGLSDSLSETDYALT